MRLYPFDLVLACSVAWALIFLGRLPNGLLRIDLFYRQIGFAGLAWMLVALLSPASILHFDVFIGLLCLLAWWRWREDHGLSGRLWLSVAAGLGISLGTVPVLAVTPGAYPAGSSLGEQLLFLAALYLGGAVIGLACILFVFTRRAATQAGVPVGLVQGYGRLLFWLTLAQAGIAFAWPTRFHFLAGSGHVPVYPARILPVLILPPLAWWTWQRVLGPAPSTGAVPLLALCVLEALAEMTQVF